MAERPPARRAVAGTLAAALILSAAWLLAPPMGTDLSAQVARAEFFAAHGWAAVDFRWYGGVAPHGYSLVSPPLMAWFGPRPVGAAAAVLASLALVALLLRTGAPRPLLGGVLGAVCFAGNLVSGRVTFALGVAFGLLALLVLVPALTPASAPPARAPRPGSERAFRHRPPPSAGRSPQQRQEVGRWAAAALLAALASATSPVAGLFVGLAGTALLLHSWLPGRGHASTQWRMAGGGLAVAAALPMAVMTVLSGPGGPMNMSSLDLWRAVLASLAVALLVPHRPVRIGALLSTVGVIAAYALPTPVGLNATRLATLFALPLLGAYAALPTRLRERWRAYPAGGRGYPDGGRENVVGRWARPAVWLTPVLVGLVLWQPPVIYRDLARAGDPAADPAHYTALRQELARRRPEGRVEVVPTVHYWESAHLDSVPLARGWLRQADIGRHPLFFDGSLDPDSYRRWLTENAVSYVVLPRAPISWVGRGEAALIEAGLPYLTEVWRDDDWVLYRVADPAPMVSGPAVVRRSTAGALVFEVTGQVPDDLLLRVRYSRRLAVTGPAPACLAPAGEWTAVRVDGPGVYEVTGSLLHPGPRC